MAQKLTTVALWATFIATFCFNQSLADEMDSTVVPGANGSDVVDATIGKIATVGQGSLSLLQPDDRLLLRIAWVETEFGNALYTYSDPNYHGGIWRVNRTMFELTRTMYNINEFSDIFEAISSTLGILWIQTTWEDCRKPLYSGVAARLFLHKASAVIPPGFPVRLQAEYWKDYYQHDPATGTVDDFIMKVSEIPGCRKVIDLVFVLDGSGSVQLEHFNTTKNFVRKVVDFFDIGLNDTRVGVVQYSLNVNVEFHLKQFTDKDAIQQAIEAIVYEEGSKTSTGDAIEWMANESFRVQNGARPTDKGIPRVAVIITDGRSNNGVDVESASDMARAMDIVLYAIGVSSIRQSELESIANKPNETYVFHVSNYEAIYSIGSQIQDNTCKELVVIDDNDSGTAVSYSNVIAQHQVQNFQQDVRGMGRTISINASVGVVELFGSATYPMPSAAFYDFRLRAKEGEGSVDIFIGREFFHNSAGNSDTDHGVSRRRRQVNNQNQTADDSEPIGTIYITIVGRQATNAFSLVTTQGDVTVPDPTTYPPFLEKTTPFVNNVYNGCGPATSATGMYVAFTTLFGAFAAGLVIVF